MLLNEFKFVLKVLSIFTVLVKFVNATVMFVCKITNSAQMKPLSFSGC